MRSTRDIKDLVTTNRLAEPAAILKRKQDTFTVASSPYTQGNSFSSNNDIQSRTMHSFKDRTNSMANDAPFKSLKMPHANGAGHASPFSITG